MQHHPSAHRDPRGLQASGTSPARTAPISTLRAGRSGLRDRQGLGQGRSSIPRTPWNPRFLSARPQPSLHSPEPLRVPSGSLTWAAAPAPAPRAAPTAPRSGLNPRLQPIVAHPGSPSRPLIGCAQRAPEAVLPPCLLRATLLARWGRAWGEAERALKPSRRHLGCWRQHALLSNGKTTGPSGWACSRGAVLGTKKPFKCRALVVISCKVLGTELV